MAQDRRTPDSRGTSSWVATRLTMLVDDKNWTLTPACRELIEWLYTVVQHRAVATGLPLHERADVVQDAMALIVRALGTSRSRYAASDNPAAVLERVAARAVGEGRHHARMAGLGSVAANGRNWRARYPRRIGGETAQRLLENLSSPEFASSPAVEDAAARVVQWVTEHVGVTLLQPTTDALTYVLDRLVAGVTRAALIRGAHSRLRTDPALRHLGFDSAAASGLGVWLLGRHDPQHNAPSVLDAALGDGPSDQLAITRWRRDALRFGLAVENRETTHEASSRWTA